MTHLVIDCSVTMAWCFEDEASGYADAALERLKTQEATVPAIWPLEVANVLLVAQRSHRLTEADSTRFLQLLGHLPLQVDNDSTAHVFTDVLPLAKSHDISSYDAAYLELAVRANCPLATLDKRLRTVAEDMGVAIV